MELSVVLTILILAGFGAMAGAYVGRARSCSTGACPLTSNPRNGAIYGAVVGGLIGFALAQGSEPTVDPEAAKHVRTVASAEQMDEATAAGGVAVVSFGAAWCGACRRFEPALANVARDGAPRVRVYKSDVDAAPELADKYGIRYLPTTLIVRDGEVVERFSGPVSEARLREMVDLAEQRERKAS